MEHFFSQFIATREGGPDGPINEVIGRWGAIVSNGPVAFKFGQFA